MRKAVLTCDQQQDYIATVDFHKSEELQKEHLVLFIHSTIEEAHANQHISEHLKNPTLADKLSQKNHLTVYPTGDTHFRIAVTYVQTKTGTEALLQSGATAAKKVHAQKEQNVSIVFGKSFTSEQIGYFLHGFHLKNYKWEWKSVPQESTNHGDLLFRPVKQIRVYSVSVDVADPQLVFLQTTVRHILKARDLGNTRADVATTDYMLQEAKNIAHEFKDKGVKLGVISGVELEKQGYGLIYSVGQGSKYAPHLVTLHYVGNKDSDKTIALVGKGVVYDSGGYAIKTPSGMNQMYMDKCGAVCVLQAFAAAVDLGLPINLVAAVGLVENMISDHAYRNSDIMVSKKGLTVENLNTDAEGRLVLADVLTHVQLNFKPSYIFDFATLTGACMIALGHSTAGIFGNDKELLKAFKKQGEKNVEALWNLPIMKEHRENMKSTYADLRNVTGATYGGASNAAAFLENFIESGVKWVHTDFAGPQLWSTESFYYTKGNTAFGVRTIVDFLKDYKF